MNSGDVHRWFRTRYIRMNSPTDSMSPRTCQNFFPTSGDTARLYPVPTGSMNTRSVWSSHVYSLSTSSNGGEGMKPSFCIFTRFGPIAPRCSHTDDDPGPPLNENVSGRFPGLGLSSVYAI